MTTTRSSPLRKWRSSSANATTPTTASSSSECRSSKDVRSENPDCVSLLQLDEDDGLGMRFYDSGMFNFLIKASDFGFGNWKRAFGYMHSL